MYNIIFIYEELIVRFHILEENYLSTDRIFLIGLIFVEVKGLIFVDHFCLILI